MNSFDFTKLPTPDEVQKRFQEYSASLVAAQTEYAKAVWNAWTAFVTPQK